MNPSSHDEIGGDAGLAPGGVRVVRSTPYPLGEERVVGYWVEGHPDVSQSILFATRFIFIALVTRDTNEKSKLAFWKEVFASISAKGGKTGARGRPRPRLEPTEARGRGCRRGRPRPGHLWASYADFGAGASARVPGPPASHFTVRPSPTPNIPWAAMVTMTNRKFTGMLKTRG